MTEPKGEMTTASERPFDTVVAVALNPAVDHTIEVAGLAPGRHLRGRRLARTPAGKAVNVARTLALLGHPCQLLGFVGRRELDWFSDYLSAAGPGQGSASIEVALIPVDGDTRENVTLVDPAGDPDTHVAEEGFDPGPGAVEQLRTQLRALAAPRRLVCFSGSLPPGLGAEAFATLIEAVQAGGSPVAVDTSGDALAAAVKRSPWLIKPNREELAQIAGEPLDDDAAAAFSRRLVEGGTSWVLASAGERGATLTSEGLHLVGRVPGAPAGALNTVGCGDALLAGFLAAQLEGLPPENALRRALAAATLNAHSPAVAAFDPAGLPAWEARAEISGRTRLTPAD